MLVDGASCPASCPAADPAHFTAGPGAAPKPAPPRAPGPAKRAPPAPPPPRQGFTATAYRRSARESRDLMRLYGDPVFAASINTMVANGYLAEVGVPGRAQPLARS